MAKRTVYAALWRYRDNDGARRVAFYGDEVDLPQHEVDRGKQLGVFERPEPSTTVAAPKPVVSESVERTLSGGIESHTPQPVLAGEDELPLPPHNVVTDPDSLPRAETAPAAPLAPINQTGIGGASAPLLLPETVVERTETERPAKSAKVDVWRDYVAKQHPELASKVDGMSKDELQDAVKA